MENCSVCESSLLTEVADKSEIWWTVYLCQRLVRRKISYCQRYVAQSSTELRINAEILHCSICEIDLKSTCRTCCLYKITCSKQLFIKRWKPFFFSVTARAGFVYERGGFETTNSSPGIVLTKRTTARYISHYCQLNFFVNV